MKVRISRFVVGAVIAALAGVAGVTPVLAQTPNFPNFSSTANLTFNGAANVPVEADFIRLTPTLTQQGGSVWFNVKQPVAGAFTTTFTFRISNGQANNPFPADGIAFVIQNDVAISELAPFGGVHALAGTGGAIGYSDGCAVPFNGCETTTSGIPRSLAVEFDTFPNSGPGPNNDPDANHVAIQSCGMFPNSADHGTHEGSCFVAIAPTSSLGGVTLADGAVHTATISYGSGRLHVFLDNHDLFPISEGNPLGGVAFDMNTLGLDNGAAWVGFTGSTGAFVENNDILSWTFTPQAQSATITAGGGTAVLNFQGGVQNNAYDYTAQLFAGPLQSATVQVKPIPISEDACELLVQASFPHAECFVYKNAAGPGVDSALMFELTCPDQPQGTCGQPTNQNFFAELGTDFTFTKAENPGFSFPGIFGPFNPFPGWLKGVGSDPLHPCTPNPGNSPALFQSNQIEFFSVVGDPTGTTKGRSGGGGSCWVATFHTSGELPPAIKITSPAFTTYKRGRSVTASYTCSDPATSKDPSTSAVGPYLMVASCTQRQAPAPDATFNTNSCTRSGTTLTCTGPVDTSILGLHLFQVNALDNGGNANVRAVVYLVVR